MTKANERAILDNTIAAKYDHSNDPIEQNRHRCLFCIAAATAGGPAFLPGDSFKLNADPLAGKVK